MSAPTSRRISAAPSPTAVSKARARCRGCIEAGLDGRKNGRGFYLYPKTKKKGPKTVNPKIYDLLGGEPRRSDRGRGDPGSTGAADGQRGRPLSPGGGHRLAARRRSRRDPRSRFPAVPRWTVPLRRLRRPGRDRRPAARSSPQHTASGSEPAALLAEVVENRGKFY